MLVSPLAVSLSPAQASGLRIPVERRRLSNGLRVVLSRDTSAPVVAVYLIYGVGARVEEKGRSGFAHLFEHMMFQGSANAPKGFHFQTVEANGGYLNGSTHPDYTDYFEVLPANKLPVALWLEADRMRGLAITEENLANQKEAVKEERRLRLDNQPYVTAIVDVWPQLAFRNWSNSHSLIGSFEDLDAATVEDVSKFFKTYYAPNNAVLVLVGHFDPDEAGKLVETYFGDIEPQPQPARPDLSEPHPEGERAAVYEDPHAQVPALILSVPGPERRSPDYYAVAMLDVILTAGDSSRFQQNLVKGRESVIQYEANLGWPFSSPADYVDPGAYGIFLVHHPHFTGRQIAAQVSEELARIQNDGVGAEELARARTFVKAQSLRQLQSSIRRAQLLGQHELLDGDAGLVNTELDRFLEVGAEEIQAAAQKYFRPGVRTLLEIVPAARGETR
jgi:predicted Zn-dependent peptidase